MEDKQAGLYSRVRGVGSDSQSRGLRLPVTWAQVPSHVMAAGLHSPPEAGPEEPASKVAGWLRASVFLQLLDCRLEPLQKGSQKPLTDRAAWESPTKAEKKVCLLRQKIM